MAWRFLFFLGLFLGFSGLLFLADFGSEHMSCVFLMFFESEVVGKNIVTDFALTYLSVSSRLLVLVELVKRVEALFARYAGVRLQWLQWLFIEHFWFKVLSSRLFPALRPLLFCGTFPDIFLLEISWSTLLSLLPVLVFVKVLSEEILQPHPSPTSTSSLVSSTLRVLGAFNSHRLRRLACLILLVNLVLLHDVTLEPSLRLEALLARIAGI